MSQDDLLSQDLQINPRVSFFLRETSKWAKFLSIVGFITTALLVLMAVFFRSLINQLKSAELSELRSTTGLTGITANFLIMALCVFVPSLFLLKFSSKMKEALDQTNQLSFEESLENLKSLFKFYGILTIIILVLYSLGVIGFLIGISSMS